MSYLTTTLLLDIRDAGSLPNSTVPGIDDTRLLRMADKQFRGVLAGLVRSLTEEYYIYHVDLDSPAQQLGVRLPSTAVGSAVRSVHYFAGPTNASTGFNNQVLRQLERVEPERLPNFQVTDQYMGLPWAFYMEAATINLIPRPAGNGALRVRYQHRPGSLVLDTDTTKVIQLNGVTAATVGGVSTWHLAAPSMPITGSGQHADILAGSSPYETRLSDTASVAWTLTTADFPQWMFQTPPAVGDWLCIPGYSPVVQLPEEMEALLATLTAASVLRSKGRAEHAKLLDDAAAVMTKQVVEAMTPRTKGNVRVVTGGIRDRVRGPWGSGFGY